MWRWLAGKSCGVCRVEGREGGGQWGGGNGLSVQEIDIPEHRTTNILVIVLSENDNTSKLFIFLCIAEHSPSNTKNITRQPYCVTAKAMLIATLVHYRCIHAFLSITAYSVDAYIGIIDYCYLILHIYCHILNAVGQ